MGSKFLIENVDPYKILYYISSILKCLWNFELKKSDWKHKNRLEVKSINWQRIWGINFHQIQFKKDNYRRLFVAYVLLWLRVMEILLKYAQTLFGREECWSGWASPLKGLLFCWRVFWGQKFATWFCRRNSFRRAFFCIRCGCCWSVSATSTPFFGAFQRSVTTAVHWDSIYKWSLWVLPLPCHRQSDHRLGIPIKAIN